MKTRLRWPAAQKEISRKYSDVWRKIGAACRVHGRVLLVVGLAAAPLRAATPVLWLDASNAATITKDVNNKVSVWRDAGDGGGPTNAGQPTLAKQPMLIANALNGRPVMDFGAFNANSNGQQMLFDAPVTNIRTVICVLRGTNFILGDDTVAHFYRGGDTATAPIWGANAAANILNGQTWLDGTLVNGTLTPLPDGFSIISLVTTGPVEANRLASDRTLRSGGQQIAEMFIYTVALTDAERQAVEASLRAKWLGATTLAAGATLDMNSASITLGSLAGSSGSQVLTGGSAAANLTIGGNGSSTTFGGVISGAGSLTKTGPGILTLAGANSLSGPVTVLGGTLRLAAIAPPGGAASPAGTPELWLDASNTTTLVKDASNKVSRWNDAGNGGGPGYVSQSTAAYQPTFVANGLSGKPILDFGPVVDGTGSGQRMSFDVPASDIRSVFWVMKGANSLLGHNASFDFYRGSPVTSGTAPLWDGTWAAANIRTGKTYLGGSLVDGTAASPSGGYFNLISLVTAGTVTANRLASDRDSYCTGGQQIAEILIYNTALSDADRLQVEGYLKAKWFVPTPLPSLAVVNLVASGATFDASGVNQTLGSLSGVAGSSVLLGGSVLQVGANDASTSFAGMIGGQGAFEKSGGGTLVLTSSAVVTATTSVTGGTLQVDPGASVTAPVQVNSGGKLSGTGTPNGMVTLNPGGIIAPGAPQGTLTLQAGLTLNPDAVLQFNLGAAPTLLTVSGTFNGNTSGTTRIDVPSMSGFGTFTLMDWSGASALSVDQSDFTVGTLPAGCSGSLRIVGTTLQLTLSVQGLQGISNTTLAGVQSAIRDLAARYPAEYATKSVSYLSQLAAINLAFQSGGAAATDGPFQALKREALVLNNPALAFNKLLFVRRNADPGLPANWQNVSSVDRNACQDTLVSLDIAQDATSNIYTPATNAFIGYLNLHWNAAHLLLTTQYGSGSARPYGIFEMNIDGTGLQQVSPGTSAPAGADVDWFDGCYLPNGDVLMCGTAGFAGVPSQGGGDYVANIYRLTRGTSTVRQLTFDQDQNWGPTVLADGRVMFTRWEYSDLAHYFSRVLMAMMPDGLEQGARYGSGSYWPDSLFDVRPIPGNPSQFVGVVSGHRGVKREGELILFDETKGTREADGVVHRFCGPNPVLPEVRDSYIDERNPWPRFIQPVPLDEKQMLVAARTSASGTTGIYLVDQFDNYTLLRYELGKNLMHPTPVKVLATPPVIPDRVKTASTTGVVNIADIHFGPGLQDVPRGKVKGLRVYSLHYTYRGQGGATSVAIDGGWDVKRILGTVPVYADGSASFTVPSNVPISVQPLDDEGKALQLFRSWFTVMPGEAVSCSGCHEDRNQGMNNQVSLASRKSPDDITPWRGAERGFSFTREVQVVLDKFCVGCHGGPGGPVNVAPQLYDISRVDGDGDSPINATSNTFPNSYVNLHKFIRRTGNEGYLRLNNPGEYQADTSELVQLLKKGHYGVTLDAEAWDRLYTWIDLNVPAFGTWGEQKTVGGSPTYATRRQQTMAAYANISSDPEAYPPAPPRGTFINPTPPTVPTALTPPADGVFNVTEAKRRRDAIATTSQPAELTLNLGNGVALILDLVPDGRFLMGSVTGYPDEFPQSVVGIARPFYMGKFEVTNKQYALYDAAHRSGFIQAFGGDHNSEGWTCNNPDQPVMRVSWKDAMGFCQWLTKQTGRKFTLPTEAQWEYACRAGTTTDMWYGTTSTTWATSLQLIPGDGFYRSGALDNFAGYEYFNDYTLNMFTGSPRWYLANRAVTDAWVAPGNVTSFASNPFGLCAMHGNVAEWTLSTYAPYPYADDSRNRAVYGDDEWLALKKVVRGASCMDRTKRGTASFRSSMPPWQRGYNVGFRVVAEPDTTLQPVPVADFSASPDTGGVALKVSVDATASSDADGSVVKYAWDFGDNTTASGSALAQHTYTVPGSYTIKLTVTDNDGFTATKALPILAKGQIGGGAAPIADIAVSPNGGQAPCTMLFNGSGSTDPDGVVAAWYWDFGDGTSGSGRLATHRYAQPGRYTASLSVVDDSGLRDTRTMLLTIGGPGGNNAPAVEAGPALIGALSDTLPLTGMVTDDGLPLQPGLVTTHWSKLTGPGSVTFANASQPATTATFSATGEYVLQLSASDGELTSQDTVCVSVLAQGPYHSPVEVAYSPDGGTLAAADQTARAIYLINPATATVMRKITLAGEPRDLVWTTNTRLFVSEHDAGTVAEIDTASGTVLRRIAVGPKPAGLAVAPGKNLLLATDRGLNHLSLIDQGTGTTRAEVSTVREPVFVTVTPDEHLAIVSNRLPYGDARDPSHAAAISFVNLDNMREVDHLKLNPGATNVQRVVCSPDGRWAYVLHVQGRPFLPTTQLSRGWVVTSAMSIIDLQSKQVYSTILFDKTSDGAADPWGITLSNDGRSAWITFAGVHEVGMLDLFNLHALLAGDVDLRAAMQYDLTTLYNLGLFQRKALPCNGPRGISLAPGEGQLAVAAWFSGQVLLLDTAGAVTAQVPLDTQPAEDAVRRGYRLYHDANGCYQRWLSCNSCHPGARVDGMNWDLLNDGFGNSKNVKSALYAPQTPPSMWTGIRANAMVGIQAGFKFIEFQSHSQQDYDDIYAYMDALRPEQSPYLVNGQLTPDAVQGKTLFESAETNCLGCHKPNQYYGDPNKYDVGTRHAADWTANDISGYVSPHLYELWRSAPYLHDGAATTVREVLTTFNPADKHGRTSHLSKNQIDQLAAYLLQLDGEVPPGTGQPWNLTVTNGDGSGTYLEGSNVTVTAAAPPPGQAFYRWTGTGIANPESSSATLTMPAGDVAVSATYLANGGWIGFDVDDNLWSSPDNWTGQAVPVPGTDELVFAGTRRLSTTNDLPVASLFKGVRFLNSAAAFILGGNGITLAGDVVNHSSYPQVINLPMVLSGTCAFDATGGEMLVANPLAGAGSIVKTGDGPLTLTGACTYAGITTVQAGILCVEADNGAATGDVSIASGAVLSGGGTLGGNVNVAGLLSPAASGPAVTLTLRAGGVLQGTATTALRVLGTSGTSDRVAVAGGTFSFGGVLTVSFNAPVPDGAAFTLFTRSTGAALAGTFAAVTATGLDPHQFAVFDPATGILTVHSRFHDWLTARNLTGSDADPLADPDKNGLTNLAEFGLLANRQSGDSSQTWPLARQSGDGYLTITFNRRTDDPALKVFVEKTDDLESGLWTTSGIEIVGTPEDILESGRKIGERVTCRILPPIAESPTGRCFARVRIEW